MARKKIVPISQSSLFEDTRPDPLELATSLVRSCTLSVRLVSLKRV
jgi:hypothetical protein